MSSAHGTLRAAGVDFGTAERMRVDQRVAARDKLLAVLGRRPKADRSELVATAERLARRAKAASRDKEIADLRKQLASDALQRVELADQLAAAGAAIEELCSLLDEAESDICSLVASQPQDLASTVKRFLAARHKRYPGVQQDIAKMLDEMALLSGWWPEDE